MARLLYSTKQKDGFPASPSPLIPSPSSPISTPYNSFNYEKESTPSPPFNGVSPILLLAIMILAAIFFISGLLHLLVRFLTKRPSFSPIFHSNRFPEASGSSSLQRQLQQLFRLHDSGLDQASIDALPVFYCKDIMGTKEPFDCAVCLCEFSDKDKLRLLPLCSHAFHIDCIDTWLLSNSTCPLCRATLLSSCLPMDSFLSFGPLSREVSNGYPREGENASYNCQKPVIVEENAGEKRIFSVRLGKFRSLNEGGGLQEETGQGESSRCNLDARRCYSMGTVQYVVAGSHLQVALSQQHNNLNSRGDKNNACPYPPADGGDVEDKKIRGRSRGESLSVSKIWQWSKSKRFPSSNTLFDVSFLTVS